MYVFSACDGMSGGQFALREAGVHVDKYYASEICKHAIKVACSNFLTTVQVGDLTKVKYEDGELYNTDRPRTRHKVKIDLMLCGSPCQGFSFAGKGLNFEDPRSKLFFEFVRLLDEIKPKYFLFENVVMIKSCEHAISRMLKVRPVKVNSKHFTAQNRVRLYWTNLEFPWHQDPNISLKDILEDEAVEVGALRGRYLEGATFQKLEIRAGNKSNALTTVLKDNVVIVDRNKSHCLDANYFKGGNLKSYFLKSRRQLVFGKPVVVAEADVKGHDYNRSVYGTEGKSPALCANTGGNLQPKIPTSDYTYRYLTPLECERLQGLPDNCTKMLSKSRRYSVIGLGWTIPVVANFLKELK